MISHSEIETHSENIKFNITIAKPKYLFNFPISRDKIDIDNEDKINSILDGTLSETSIIIFL